MFKSILRLFANLLSVIAQLVPPGPPPIITTVCPSSRGPSPSFTKCLNLFVCLNFLPPNVDSTACFVQAVTVTGNNLNCRTGSATFRNNSLNGMLPVNIFHKTSNCILATGVFLPDSSIDK